MDCDTPGGTGCRVLSSKLSRKSSRSPWSHRWKVGRSVYSPPLAESLVGARRVRGMTSAGRCSSCFGQRRNSVQCAGKGETACSARTHAGGGCSCAAHIRTDPRRSLGYEMVVTDSSRLLSAASRICGWMTSSGCGAFRDMKVWR